jgi:hypothetical protein
MKRKKIWSDPGLWILAGTNTWLVIHYYRHPGIFPMLIWIYWYQSVMLGGFNFLDMLTVPLKKKDTTNPNDFGNYKKSGLTRWSAFFFLIHYGLFHFVYVFFLPLGNGQFDHEFFRYSIFAFLVGQIINFVQEKAQQRTVSPNLGKMLFLPYLRILPMHITILLPVFMHISSMGVFLIMKSLADVAMYIATKPAGGNKESNEALIASHAMRNME